MSYTVETNIKICKNLSSDAPISLMNKIREARGALEAFVQAGVYPPGEYVISRKGLKGNQAVDWDTTGCWGHSLVSAVTANALGNTGWDGNHLNLWVNRTDKAPVFKTTKDNDRYYLALSTATLGMFTSEG
ncbi:MAG: hypothetical protein CBC29_06385 [Methylococcaceae bacterium TMED69]|nr:MAG: hypothetical protein CBC29_06385 [Methylococcaceae bacterium TMED69]